MEDLQTVIVFQTSKGPRQLGGPGEPSVRIQQSCLGRMKAWLKLVVLVVRAEWPDFSVLQAYSVLGLSNQHKQPLRVADSEEMVTWEGHVHTR